MANLENLKPFKKGQSGNPSGLRKKTTAWKNAEEALREALPRILMMEKNKLQILLQSNPNGIEMLAAKYVHEHPIECVNRFLGKIEEVIKQENTGHMIITFDPGTD